MNKAILILTIVNTTLLVALTFAVYGIMLR